MRPMPLAVLCLALAGCPKQDDAPAAPHAATPVAVKREVTLTFLVTGAENGYLLPADEPAGKRGGAAETLGRWVADEGHCAGPLGDRGAPACEGGRTLVLSTGDNANGQAISSFFKGASTAEVMRQMGYAASAFGNRELDWSHEQFLANTKAGGFPYLAANLLARPDAGTSPLNLKPYRLLERQGVKVAVVGLAARKATWTPMPGRMAGLELVDDDVALGIVVPAAKQDGADVVAIVSDGCLNDFPELLLAHPEWGPAFVAGRDCERDYPDVVGGTRLVYPGRHWREYARVSVTVDLARPAGQRVTFVDSKLVEVLGSNAPEPKAAEVVAGWKKKLDEALGERIGFSKAGIEQESAAMSAWLTTALKDTFGTDVALLNRKGVRQGLPAGPLTKATVWDLVPFDNEIVTVTLTGAQVLEAAANVEARFAGLRAKGDGFIDGKGQPIDPKKAYSLATTDYLYLGGDGFKLREAAPTPTPTGKSWQATIIEWTAARKSDEKRPLEAMLKR